MRGKSLLWGLIAGLFWLGVWTAVALAVDRELLVPTPWAVAATLWRLAGTKEFWQAAGASLLRVAAGFAAGVAAGSLLGVLTARFAPARRLFSPLLKVIRATPVASFIILAFVWLVTDILPAFISFLMVLPVVWANVEEGIRQEDQKLLEMAQVFRWNRAATLLHLRIPAVMPYFLTGCTTALGLAWKSGVAAEVICRPSYSVGKLLQTAKANLETQEVFAYTVAVILFSVALERLLLILVKRLGARFNVE